MGMGMGSRLRGNDEGRGSAVVYREGRMVGRGVRLESIPSVNTDLAVGRAGLAPVKDGRDAVRVVQCRRTIA